MHLRRAAFLLLLLLPGASLGAQQEHGRFRLAGMAQAYPVLTHVRAAADDGLADTGAYLTQPVVMGLLEAPAADLRPGPSSSPAGRAQPGSAAP